MKVNMINPFISAAREELRMELGSDIERNAILLNKSAETSGEATAMLAVSGRSGAWCFTARRGRRPARWRS